MKWCYQCQKSGEQQQWNGWVVQLLQNRGWNELMPVCFCLCLPFCFWLQLQRFRSKKRFVTNFYIFFLTSSACWNNWADSSLHILHILLCTQMKADIPDESFHLTGLMLWWGPHNQLQAQLNLKAIWSTQAPTVKLLTRGCSTTETFLWKRNVILSMCLRIMLSERLQFSCDSTNMTQDFNTEETDFIYEDFVKD